MRKKVELEDIIGIVKTDEPTNSVELKKEAYNDTKKQFKFDRDTVATNLKTPIVYDGERMSIGEVLDKLNELHEENQRLTNKLNQTALELVDEVISQGKATEISEMSYHEFLDYRAKNGKPMELQL